MAEGEKKYCSNCKRDIAVTNFVMHEVHCKKNIILCEKCKEPVARSELENHNEEEHALVECNMCNGSFENRFIDDHKENCPRRPAQCAYCEIECPRDELDTHLEYCGTRTEACLKCLQYIMHKDLNRHEESNCTYPEPRGNPNVAEDSSEDVIIPGMGMGDFSNSFVRGEMQRILLPPGVRGAGSDRQENNSRRGFSNLRGNTRDVVQRRNPIGGTHSRRGAPHASFSSGWERTRRENYKRMPNNEIPTDEAVSSYLNRERANNTTSNRPTVRGNYSERRETHDRMLAAQLANDLALDNNAIDDQLIAEDLAARESVVRNEPRRTPSLDEVLLPCEYCGEQFPLSALLQHQDTCNTVHASNNHTPSNQSAHTDPISYASSSLNNAGASSSSPNNNGQLRVIDNLSLPLADEWAPTAFDEDGSVVLFPCEFCSDTFPEDVLIQHQSICDSNPYKTPRVMTPKVTNSQRAVINRHTAGSTGASPANSYSNRPRNPPNLHIPSTSTSRYGTSRTSRNITPGTKSPEVRKHETAARNNHVLDEFMHNPSYTPVNLNYGQRPSASGAEENNMYRYGVNGASRQPRQSSRPKPVARSTFDTRGLDGAGTSLRTTGRSLPPSVNNTRTNKPRGKRPQRDV